MVLSSVGQAMKRRGRSAATWFDMSSVRTASKAEAFTAASITVLPELSVAKGLAPTLRRVEMALGQLFLKKDGPLKPVNSGIFLYIA